MTKTISELLATIRAREDAATEGPWKANASGRVSSENGPLFIADITKMIIGADPPNGNLEFIANARTDVTRLRRALEKAIEQRDALATIVISSDLLRTALDEANDELKKILCL